MKKKKVLIGYDDFVALLENSGYFVDKSLLIKELIDKPNQVTLITRPRRFGKSLNFSMLKYFWENTECRVANSLLHHDVSHLFSDLAISAAGEEYMKEQGQFPVIFLSFRGAKMNVWEDTARMLIFEIAREFKRHQYLLRGELLSPAEKEKYGELMNEYGSLAAYSQGILVLSGHLNRYFGKNVIVLIDEYDTPIQQGYLKNYFEPVLNFFRTFLVEGLKGNDCLQRAVITGIMKVAQESVFSSFNNPSVSTITDLDFADKFGFTESEVNEFLETFDLGERFQDVKSWYNGYIFGKVHNIYNPWSITKYIYDKGHFLKPYWVNTSDNELIGEALQMDTIKSKGTLKKLIRGEEVREVIVQNIVYRDITTEFRAGWNFLLQSGYLKASDPIHVNDELSYNLQIPNVEVRALMKSMVMSWFSKTESVHEEMEELVIYLQEENWPLFEDRLQEIFDAIISYYDTASVHPRKKKAERIKYENFYHGLFLGLLVQLQDTYTIESNREYGLGRPDLVVLPHSKDRTAIIFEFKAIKTTDLQIPEEAAQEALEQCDKKKYATGLKAKGYTTFQVIGIGFKGKELKMLWEQVHNKT
jgi:hypothetical protein